jgi:5-methylcytosine-specific restriction endonuclease McrA
MKRKLGETREHFSHRQLWTRTSSIWRHQKERAAKLNLPFCVTLDSLRAFAASVLAIPCVYCGARITPKNLSLDHPVPISRGGYMDGYIFCCNVCNERKGSLTGNEYSSLVSMLYGWPDAARIDVLRRLRAGSKALRRMFAK